ncbi:MAG: CpsD/CapB family tyrosine-protein kinase [Novosphingobium sp.]
MQEQSIMETPPAPLASAPRPSSAEPVSFALSREVIVKSLPQSPTAESIHALRTHLVARHIQDGRRGLAVCDTEGSAGEFLAVNLAISMAESGVRTLLIDTNIRAPELGQYIQPSSAVAGLADAIEQPDVPIGFAIQNVLPNLSLIYAGGPRENSLELLGNPKFARIVDLCMREFDFTIATTPPSNRFADARRVASVMRYALVVARKDVTFIEDVNTLVSELASDSAQVIGAVYNDF